MSFYKYMQNRAVGATNPHIDTPDLSYLKQKIEEENTPKEVAVKFDANMTIVAGNLAKRAGLKNVAELVDTALHILDSIMTAADMGKTDMFLVNPINREDVIYMDLSKTLGSPKEEELKQDDK